MPRQTDYRCTMCGEEPKDEFGTHSRDLLMAKKVVFYAVGNFGQKVHRSRVTDRLCPACLVKDAAWQQPNNEYQRKNEPA